MDSKTTDNTKAVAEKAGAKVIHTGKWKGKGAVVDREAVTKFRRCGIFFLSLVASIFSGQRITDVLAGFKAFRKPVLQDINMKEDHYGYEAEVVIRAAQKGYKILDVPIEYRKREKGASNVIPIKHGFLFLGTILKVGMNRK